MAVPAIGLADDHTIQGASAPVSQVLSLQLTGTVTAVPEPSCLVLASLGVAGALLFHRKRRRQAG